MFKYWMIGATSAALLGGASVAASAAPASNAAGLKSTHQPSSAVEQVADRRCWWRNGVRRCSSYRSRPRVYGYRYYGGHVRPEDLPTGSTAWWRSMDFYDRGGFGGRP